MKEFKLKENEIKELTTVKGGCIASDRITVDGQKVGYMYRENPTTEADSGWRFFSGDENDEYATTPSHKITRVQYHRKKDDDKQHR